MIHSQGLAYRYPGGSELRFPDVQVPQGAVLLLSEDLDELLSLADRLVVISEGRIAGIEEKPTQFFTVSAGMYVLSPQVLDLVPPEQFFDMPSLFEAMIQAGLHTRCHKVDGYWLDIGQLPDYERAKADFEKIFP